MMLQNRKSRIWFIVLVALTIINLAAVATLVVQVRKFHRMTEFTPPMKDGLRDSLPAPMGPGRLMDELGFDDQQRDAFNNSRRVFRDKASPLFIQIRELNNELADELDSGVPDTLKMATMSRQIGELHVQLKLLTIRHMLDVKSLTSPEQRGKLGQFYRDVLSRDGRPPGKGMQHRYRHGRGEGSR